MKLSEITPVVLTFNEEVNIGRCLNGLAHFSKVIVLDSGSSDSTRQICSAFENTHWEYHPFQSFASQWNHAIRLVNTPWMLALDADYILTPALVHKLQQHHTNDTIHGFEIPFRYCVQGCPLKNSLLPPRITLFRPSSTRVKEDGHTQTFLVNGHIEKLNEPLWHDDRKPFSRWWASQEKYAEMEVEKLSQTPWSQLSVQDKLRKLIFPAPPAVLFFTLIRKGCLFDGKPGWIYSGQRFLAEALLSFKLLLAWLKA